MAFLLLLKFVNSPFDYFRFDEPPLSEWYILDTFQTIERRRAYCGCILA